MFLNSRSLFRCVLAVLTLVVFKLPLLAQSRDDSFFKDGESVNFIGNSITHGGEFHSYIHLYYATRFPAQPITFYNSGIWGDSANQMLRRMDKDILTNKSDYAVIMAGMNDVNRLLYSDKRKNESDIEILREKALDDYRKNLEKLIVRLKEEGIKVIVQKPSIYDQTAKIPMENMFGVNDALAKCCAIIDSVAAKYKLQVVDYYSAMNGVNQILQEKDSSATVVSYDRIHPATAGSFLMASEFLKETHNPSEVSSVGINRRGVFLSSHCKISQFQFDKKRVSFVLEQESLPFPIPPNAKKVAEIINFDSLLNQETLKIQGLKKGKYTLLIDQIEVGSFLSDELAKGVNLSKYNTPQHIQAEEVAKEIMAYRQVYKGLRDIKIVEINFLPKAYFGAKYETVIGYIDQLREDDNPVFTKNKYYFNLYFKSKPIEQQLELDLNAVRKRIYRLSKPIQHYYSLQLQR